MSGAGTETDPLGGRWTTVCVGDHFGRLIGKRIPARRFDAVRERGLATPDFHLVTSVENVPHLDMAVTGAATGFRNGLLVPMPGKSFVLPDQPATEVHLARAVRLDGAPYEEAPRRILERQAERLADAGLVATVATELEFYLFAASMREAVNAAPMTCPPFWERNADNDVFLTDMASGVLDGICACLDSAGIPVEAVQGEGGPGQFEVNVGHGDPLEAADRQLILKHVVRHVARAAGLAATFMAKPRQDWSGSGGHIHIGLQGSGGAEPPRTDSSEPADAFIAGILRHAAEMTLMYCPLVNSYRRFAPGNFAPAKPTWGEENRTAMVRRVADERGRRFEFRLPGSDMNPYHAIAAALASGLHGVKNGISLPPPCAGNAEEADVDSIPADFSESIRRFAEVRAGGRSVPSGGEKPHTGSRAPRVVRLPARGHRLGVAALLR